MAQTIKLKRSATTGNAPTASQLALGELGINTTDGKLFLKKSVSGTESIVEVGGLPLSGGTLTGNLSLGQNNKAIFNSQLEVYGDGSNSHIKDTSSGNLNISGNDIQILNAASNEAMAYFAQDGDVTLYHNGSPKIATTSTGIDVTGSVVADGLTVDGNGKFSGTTPIVRLTETDTTNLNTRLAHGGGYFFVSTENDAESANTPRISLNHATGDISFYDSSGSSQNLFWDASTSQLFLGATSASALNSFGDDLVISNTASGTGAGISIIANATNGYSNLYFGDTADGDVGRVQYNHADNSLTFRTNTQNALVIDSSQNATFSGSVTSTGLTVSTIYPKLQLNSTSGVPRNFSVGTNNETFTIRNETASSDSLTISNANRVNIPQSLMVGATTAPSSRLHIKAADNNYTGGILIEDTDSLTKSGITHVNGGLYLSSNATNDHLEINSSGNASFSGAVSVGGATPQGNLTIKGSASDDIDLLTFSEDGTNQSFSFNGNFAGTGLTGNSLCLDSYWQNDIMVWRGDGNVGLGISSPDSKMHLYDGALHVQQTDGSDTWFGYGSSNDNYITTGTGGVTVFREVGSEKMRLSGGNLLVGTTSTSLYNDTSGGGINLFANGGVTLAKQATSVSDPVLLLNNTGTAGQMIDLRQDGTTVGSIGSASGQLGIDSQGTRLNLQLGGTTKAYVRSSSLNPSGDGTFDLGESSERFKDLYLSNNATAQKLTLTKDPVGTYTIEVDGTNTGQPNLIIKQSTSERFRCDNNGNLLVGTTDTTIYNNLSGDGGIVLAKVTGGGRIDASRAGSCYTANRLGSDGQLFDFRKNGGIVGRISTVGNDLVIGSSVSGHKGVRFGSSYIAPINTSDAFEDNTTDLGLPAVRFKDLYLSHNMNATNAYLGSGNEIGWGGTYSQGKPTISGYNSELNFYSAGSTSGLVMKLTSGGNLLVGTTGANTYSSTVNTGVQIAPDFIGVARNQNTVMHLNRQGNDGTIVDFRTFGFVRGSVSISGSTTSYNTSSDERLKDNIIDAPIASEDIDAIQVRSFDWKADGEHQKYGMVAQELLEVAPDAVTQGDTPDDMMGVDYSKLVPMLIKEIQSLRQRVAQLEE